jgi:hypothetical protein
MSKGYLLFALDNQEVNYSKLAIACALTIKLTQPDEYNSVSVITNNTGYFDKDLFDHIIPAGFLSGMDARSRAYDHTPYDETVLLDSDMLFLKPMDHYWDIVKDMDLFISTSPQTHRGVPFQFGFYRNVFISNKLPDVYNAWTYFKKSETARQFFELVKLMTDNPREFINVMIPNSRLTSLPTDEAFALALIQLELEDKVTLPNIDFPRITHMKPAVQRWSNQVSDWQEKLRFTVDEQGQVKLGVWGQSELLHYVKKELITDDIIKTLRSAL